MILLKRRLWSLIGATPSTITNAGTAPPTDYHPSTTKSGNPGPSRKRHRKPSTISGNHSDDDGGRDKDDFAPPPRTGGRCRRRWPLPEWFPALGWHLDGRALLGGGCGINVARWRRPILGRECRCGG